MGIFHNNMTESNSKLAHENNEHYFIMNNRELYKM